MDDLISRTAAIAWFFRPYSNEEYYSNLDVERALKAIPAVDAAPVARQWISVKDRLPDKAGIYIICDHYGKFAGYWHFNGSAKYGNPTHWMPLPEPPKMDGDA